MRTSIAGPHSVHAQRGCVCLWSAMRPGLAGRCSSCACVCAERAGVRIGSVYPYFPNKASIRFQLQSEWNGHAATCGRAYRRQIFEAAISVIGKDECTRPEAALHQAQDFRIERLGSSARNATRLRCGWRSTTRHLSIAAHLRHRRLGHREKARLRPL